MFYLLSKIVVEVKEGQNPGKSSDEKYFNITRTYDNKLAGEPHIMAEFADDDTQRPTFPFGEDKYSRTGGSTAARRKRREGE